MPATGSGTVIFAVDLNTTRVAGLHELLDTRTLYEAPDWSTLIRTLRAELEQHGRLQMSRAHSNEKRQRFGRNRSGAITRA